MAKQISMFISISLLCILSNAWIVSSFQIGRSPDSTAVNEEETDLFIEENTPIYGSSHGSTGGSAFNDKKDLVLPDRTPCIGVEAVWDSRQLLALRFIYGSDDNAGWSIFHGDSNVKGASREKFMMEPGEKITKITTYVGSTGMSYAGKLITFVLGIQFGTNKGRSSQVFGSEGGEKKVETHDGYVVGYVIGRGGRLLDQLQVVWQSQETVKVNAKNHFTALCPKSPESLTLAIISAFYRNKDKPKLEVKDVGDRVQQRCNNEKSCTLLVDDKILKITPCKSCTKELEVTYTCSSQELIFGPELKDRAYKGHVIMVDREKSVSGVDDVIRCGQYCLKEPRCVGVQIGRNQECYLKSAMEAYIEKPGWISMAVVNRSRDT